MKIVGRVLVVCLFAGLAEGGLRAASGPCASEAHCACKVQQAVQGVSSADIRTEDHDSFGAAALLRMLTVRGMTRCTAGAACDLAVELDRTEPPGVSIGPTSEVVRATLSVSRRSRQGVWRTVWTLEEKGQLDTPWPAIVTRAMQQLSSDLDASAGAPGGVPCS